MIRIASCVLAICALAACPKPAATPHQPDPEPPAAAADQAVTEGDGWTRTAPGTWTYSTIDDSENAFEKLGAEPGGRGIARYDLPAGAKGGDVSEISVLYDSNGEVTWSIHAQGDGDAPSETALGTAHVKETDAEYQSWSHDRFDPPAPVTGTFYLFFETPDGEATVSAIQARGDSNLMYQPPGGTAEVAPFEPFVRVTLTNVH